jgi:hypothetical protein
MACPHFPQTYLQTTPTKNGLRIQHLRGVLEGGQSGREVFVGSTGSSAHAEEQLEKAVIKGSNASESEYR